MASCVFLSLSHSPVIFFLLRHILEQVFFHFFFHLLLFCNLFDCFLASVYSHSIVLLPLFHVSFAMPFHTLAFYFYCIACIPCKRTSEWVYASMCCILQLPSFQAFCLFLARRKKTNKETKRNKNKEWEMFVFQRTVYYDNSMEFIAVWWQKMNECGVMTPNKNLAGNRQRLFANFQYDWINGMCIKRAWNEEQNVSTRSARLLIAMPCQRPQKRFIFMVVGCVFIVSLNGNIIINDFEHTNKYVILSTAPMG